MTAPLSAERVEKLKQWLWHPAPKYYSLTTRDDIRRDIEVIIDDDSSLRAENELLNNNAMNDYAAHLELKARAEKSEAQLAAMRAENERLRAEFSTLKKAYDDECAWRGRGYRDLLTRAEKAEAKLDKVAPLVEAVEKWDGRMTWGSVRPLIQSIDDYRAALKYREERGEK
jgi:hypothetical protein